MDFEAWWLVFIPLIFALGWLAAKGDTSQLLFESKRLPESYFKGLNFLFNEDHDRAIDAFMEVAELDTETIELHFALGNLFRRRGEIERAIRVHQSLLTRDDLPEPDQQHALYELGQDYFKAGMFDRAENAFKEVLETHYRLDAIRALIRIYEAEHDWSRALDTVKLLQAMRDEAVPQVVHYYCELAQQALLQKPADVRKANSHLQHALNFIERHPELQTSASTARVQILQAQMAQSQHDVAAQAQHLRQVLALTPNYADLVAEPLMQCCEQSQQVEEGLADLQAHYQAYPSLSVFKTILAYKRKYQSEQDAWEFARASLQHHPSILGLDKLLEVELKQDDEQSTKSSQQLTFIRSNIHKQASRLDRFVCNECGFQTKNFYWQCPGCHQWDTYTTQRLEEL
ncbi:lipopolysaccharide assembly protein LapB [Brackiella oedipodis]|uniref:lipopolysaccharide assembly protein LapB n=1 Tax=Brackiella oedipodis TaxID=124225 RepID=UPI00048B8591|nr:lipopolysaccharide assembly protein LapB [Brackiella oedipodis]